MATMVKEKRREKKKTKIKQFPEIESNVEENLVSSLLSDSKEKDILPINVIQEEASTSSITEEQPSSTTHNKQETQVTTSSIEETEKQVASILDTVQENPIHSSFLSPVPESKAEEITSEVTKVKDIITKENKPLEQENSITNELQNILTEAKKSLNEIILDEYSVTNYKADSVMTSDFNKIQEVTLDNFELEITTLDSINFPNLESQEEIVLKEDLRPSAPLAQTEMEAQPYISSITCEKVLERARLSCMPLEEAVRVFGGKEIAEVKALSKKEEAIVEAGPQSGPDHPLVDLLSTFRTSLIAIERERNRISSGYVNEEKSQATLWVVEKRNINVTQQCPCGSPVSLKLVYEVARLQTEKMPAAKLRLEALLRDVQECYCHHQHAALQAHYDVDELVAEILQSNKSSIRTALLLVLQALQLSDAAPEAFAAALQRWASILASSLLDNRDLGHLLFLLHSLFRQTRSVQWAGRVIELQVSDTPSAARLLALLELLLTRPLLEEAQECTEECEAWEEVDTHGEGGAVGEGRFRERDLLALLDALPLQDMLARMLLFSRTDIIKEDEQSWGDRSGGHGVLKASCGVRVLLGVLQRALHAHASYSRLRARLRRLASAALASLAALHLHSKSAYAQELEERIAAELEACFVAGFSVLQEEAHSLPATLLSHNVARDYCHTLITGLHERRPLRVASLAIVLEPQACERRVRTATQAALDRELDGELSATVLEFLFQVGIKRKWAACGGSCDVTARELLPQLLAQRRLHSTAFHKLADLNQVETIDPSLLQSLAPRDWRPSPGEACALLDEWAARCAPLIQHLLLEMDYTPHTGVSLESQLAIGSWLCSWLRAKGEASEWAWQVLRALRLHRTQWGLPLEAPSPEPAEDLLSTAYALMASDWGHCLPLVCGPGVEALWRLARARPEDTARCAGPLMRVMAQSPESVSLTPKFAEVFTAILNSGPTLVQRALGRRTATGAELLQQLLMRHMQDTRMSAQERSALLSAWLHALWRPSVPACARAALDQAMRACRDWRTLDAHAALLLQEENAKEYIVDAVRNVSVAPLLCESIVRNAHALEVQTQMHARLLLELARQKAAGHRIHVDNALKQIGSSLTDDELPIHRCACAALCAPPQHPAHLLLLRLFLHMYLQRPPAAPPDSPPVGPLFFSGLVKSRTLSQLKKRLQETATYHRAQIEVLKSTEGNVMSPSTSESSKENNSNPTTENNLFSTLAILDLTGDDSESDESSSDRECDINDDRGAREASVDRDTHNLICYHTAAEKVVREYWLWLEEGASVRAAPHHADIARFLSEQALETAWRASLSKVSSAPNTPTSPASARPDPTTLPQSHTTHCERAVRAILDVKRRKRRRYKIPDLPSINDDAYFRDAQLVVKTIQKELTELEKLTREWMSDVDRVSKLDVQLWELVGRLRARRPLPPVQRSCAQGCKPVTIHVAKDEWCISSGAEQGIQENRRRARAAIRRLSRPRPHDAKITSRVHSLGRRIRSQAAALRVAEIAANAAARTEAYAPAHEAVTGLVADVAARFICCDAKLATQYLNRWSAGAGGAQQKLCLMLIIPSRLAVAEWPALYTAILALKLPPHVTFTYISKFDLSVWADAVESDKRTEVLEALEKAAQRLGPQPDDQYLMLLELLGVQSSSAVRRPELCAHILRCAHACVSCAVPPLYLKHLPSVVDKYGDGLDFDQLGHFLRQLGVIFWKARASEATSRTLFAAYAPHFADTLHALLREFVAAAVGRTYGPERVAVYAWSGVREAWSAWVTPHASAPLLPSTADQECYTEMLARFTRTVTMIMQDCPGSEEVLLRRVFEWTVDTYLGMEARWPQEGRVQMSALLVHLAALPWQRQWFHVEILPLCLQMSRSAEHELTSWCSACMRHLETYSWVQGASDERLTSTLADLLEIFTSKQLALSHETLEGACALPWWRVPELALNHALERYFAEHHSPALPYHHAPQFRVLLFANHLIAPADVCPARHAACADKRANAVSQWVRAATSPALLAHVSDHSTCLLSTLTHLAPHLEESCGELEQLLGRGVVVLGVEPAAAMALPVWQNWVSTCPARLRHAAASAAATLTTLDYFAALGEAVAKAILNEKDSAGWSAVSARWAQCPWWEGGALVSRGGLHAAYAMLLARPHSYAHLTQTLNALLNYDINFANNEVMVAVWISVACRAAVQPRGDADCADAARALLARWAEQKRTLLQVVTLHSADNCPTTQHRLLCRLALCVVSPSEANVKAYESACSALLGSADAVAWARRARADMLPRLAVKLYLQHEVYFKEELDLTANLV
ncbi:uncharacterized protein LOC123868718 [Maniola jurtina]|uniref:uncharacterized protein LOC123868718 n=1 Tax=Maniola jurtina TaxID=191418 RepID=UPI001E6874DB|nr:uncharacterized protein LOC123868718 [Maniola jurtina]